jgi:hypothetical protein
METDHRDSTIQCFANNILRLGNECRALAEENARLKAEVESRQKDMNEMFREIKEGREAYQRLHHLYLTAKEGKQ